MELTKQDIDVISNALHSWANQAPSMGEIESIATRVIGGSPCPCAECTAKRGGTSLAEVLNSHRDQIQKECENLIAHRRERAAVVTAKLIAMRDSIVADQFFASIGDQKI